MELLTSPLFCLLAFIGVVLTGISKSGFAGGAGVVAIPLLALVIPITDAVVMMLPLLLIMDARTIQYYRAHANTIILKRVVPAAILGIAIGGALLGEVSTNTLQLVLAIISLLFASWHQLSPLLAKCPGGSWLWGTLSGLSSTLIHAGGPPINIYLLGQSMSKQSWLATAAIFFGVMNLLKLIPYTLNDQWNLTNLVAAGAFIPVAFLGVWLGKALQHKLKEQHFVTACRLLLFLSGLTLLAKSFA